MKSILLTQSSTNGVQFTLLKRHCLLVNRLKYDESVKDGFFYQIRHINRTLHSIELIGERSERDRESNVKQVK